MSNTSPTSICASVKLEQFKASQSKEKYGLPCSMRGGHEGFQWTMILSSNTKTTLMASACSVTGHGSWSNDPGFEQENKQSRTQDK